MPVMTPADIACNWELDIMTCQFNLIGSDDYHWRLIEPFIGGYGVTIYMDADAGALPRAWIAKGYHLERTYVLTFANDLKTAKKKKNDYRKSIAKGDIPYPISRIVGMS